MSSTTVSALTDLRLLTDQHVSVNIAQDGAALGSTLYTSTGKSIGSMGAQLGTIAASAVSQSIAEVGAFNISDGTEFDTPAFSTGELVRNITPTLQGQLHDYGYVFLRKFAGTVTITGSYWNSERTAIISTSDYNTISRNRTINKAVRGVREAVLPLLSSRVYLNTDGTLQTTDIANFQTAAGSPLSRMQSDGDLSGDQGSGQKGYAIVIDPTQQVLSNKTLNMTIKLLPVGVTEFINITIGFVLKLS
jgi:hypothetical protein